ncbi:MAG: helix-turn-helix domain-containing protein, partial [Corynebacterium flavescens]|nr:helix-turn-helix domain-containing protein [Corynebacterium flavescens]
MGVSVKFRKFGRQALDRLGRGEPASRIAADLGIASSTVSAWARQSGLGPYRRYKRRRKPENIARDMAIIDLLLQSHSVHDIADSLGVSIPTVYKTRSSFASMDTIKRVDPHGQRVRGIVTV